MDQDLCIKLKIWIHLFYLLFKKDGLAGILLEKPYLMLLDDCNSLHYLQVDNKRLKSHQQAKLRLDNYVAHLFKFEENVVTPNKIIGCTVHNMTAHMWLYERSNNNSSHVNFVSNTLAFYQLMNARDRIRLATNFICLYVICANESRKMLKTNNNPLQATYLTLTRPTGYVQRLYDDQLLKMVHLSQGDTSSIWAIQSLNGLDDLVELYQLLHDRKIANTVQCVDFKISRSRSELAVIYAPSCDREIFQYISQDPKHVRTLLLLLLFKFKLKSSIYI